MITLKILVIKRRDGKVGSSQASGRERRSVLDSILGVLSQCSKKYILDNYLSLIFQRLSYNMNIKEFLI